MTINSSKYSKFPTVPAINDYSQQFVTQNRQMIVFLYKISLQT